MNTKQMVIHFYVIVCHTSRAALRKVCVRYRPVSSPTDDSGVDCANDDGV